MRPIILVSALGLLLAGCGGADPPTAGPPVVILVQNNNFQDATVFAIRQGERHRLGVVVGKTDERFAIPWQPNFVLRLEVRFLGGGACSTRDILLEPGQRYTLELQPDTRLNLDCRAAGG